MNFKVFQKANKKLILWSGATGLTFLLIGLIIIFLLSAIAIQIRVSLAIQLFTNVLLIWLIFILINKFQTLNSVVFKIATFHHPKSKKVVKSEIILNPWIYLFLFIFFAIIWLCEVLSFYFWINDWNKVFRDYWWFCLILLVFNYCFYYLFFKIKIYLVNQDLKKSNLEK